MAQDTDPLQPDTAQDKDHKAYQALKIIGDFTRSMAGWAVYHHIGLAKKGLDWVPGQPSGAKGHEEYLARKLMVDSHEHEDWGRSLLDYGDLPSQLDGRFLRQLLRNLLYPNPLKLPDQIRQSYLDSLDASKNNEALGFLDIPRAGHQENATEATKLKLAALGFFYFFVAEGLSKTEARADIGLAFGVEVETVRGWEVNLKKAHSLELSRTKSFAENIWSSINCKEGQSDPEGLSLLKSYYNLVALEKAGSRYQAIKRSGKKKM